MISIRTLSASFAAVALSIATVAASAEKWPARPIKVISPFTAGNAGDTVARIVFDQVSQQIGQTLFIENRPAPAVLLPQILSPRAIQTATRFCSAPHP